VVGAPFRCDAVLGLLFAFALGGCGEKSADGFGAGANGLAVAGGSGTPDAAQATVGAEASDAAAAAVPIARNHMNRDGLFTNTDISKTSVPTFRRDESFEGTFSGGVHGSALYVENRARGSGAFFVATDSNYVYALDEATGMPLPGWPIQAGPPALRAAGSTECTGFSPIGITGTPAIDLETRLVVFDAVTGDTEGNIVAHTIQGWSIDDPAKGPRWTLDVSAKWPAFHAGSQNQRGAVLIVKGVAYITFGSFNDCSPFHGWVVGVPLANPSAAQAYMTPVIGAGIWGPGGPASDGTSIFAVTGNRTQDLDSDASPRWAGSNAVFRFGPDLTFSGERADYFAPPDWDVLDRTDLDLGSSGPLLIDAPAMKPSALVVTLGKSGVAYLLDRNNLGGLDAGPVASATIVQGLPGNEGQIINAAAWATVSNTTYIVVKGYFEATAADCPLPQAGTGYDLLAVRLDPDAPNRMQTAWCVASGGMGSPSITMSDASHDALVWTEGAEGDNGLHAWDLVTGAPVYFSGEEALGPARRFTTPIAVHGRVFVAGDGTLYAFKSGPASGR
jgi:hypothetical protein